MTKLAKTHITLWRKHTHRVKESSPLFPLNCPCHTYKELVQQIHELPLTSQCVPPLCSWFRPAVVALAASGADPPHLNASDIYLGRTTGGRGGRGVETTYITSGFVFSSCFSHGNPPPLSSTLFSVRCFADETMCSGCLCRLRENKMVLSQRWDLRCHGLFFFFFLISWIAAVWGRWL